MVKINVTDSLTQTRATLGRSRGERVADEALLDQAWSVPTTATMGQLMDSDLEEVRGVVAGDWVELGRLASLLDKNALTKLHKLKPEEFQDLTGSLCSRIAAKDAL